jgi:hypothetical protein
VATRNRASQVILEQDDAAFWIAPPLTHSAKATSSVSGRPANRVPSVEPRVGRPARHLAKRGGSLDKYDICALLPCQTKNRISSGVRWYRYGTIGEPSGGDWRPGCDGVV